jgi:hypothetical protein
MVTLIAGSASLRVLSVRDGRLASTSHEVIAHTVTNARVHDLDTLTPCGPFFFTDLLHQLRLCSPCPSIYALHAFSSLPLFFFRHIPYRSRRKTMSLTLIVGFSLSFFFFFLSALLYSPNFFRPAFLRCATLVIYWSSIHRPSLRATSWNGLMQGRHWPF